MPDIKNLQNKKSISLALVIPVLDEPEIFETLKSIYSCDLRDNRQIDVFVIVNHSSGANAEIKIKNSELYEMLKVFSFERSFDSPTHGKKNFKLHIIKAFDLDVRYAGVGLARKLAMDAAVEHFTETGCSDGIIASLDADTLVATNYIDTLLSTFEGSKISGASIYFEHPFENEDYDVKSSIIKYELYLRYYRHALAWLQHPYSHYAVGSAFVVRARDYKAVGGMNRRQAGEDFYFIQKLIAGRRFVELNSTAVYPSARISERTPFGTGQAVKSIIANGGEYSVYNFNAFLPLKPFFEGVVILFKVKSEMVDEYMKCQKEPLKSFLADSDFVDSVSELNDNTGNSEHFVKRFFDYFNAFKVLKYLNYAHSEFFEKQEVLTAARCLFNVIGLPAPSDELDALMMLRAIDKQC
ncbi:MAG: hypothetical protein LBM07_07840 [Culturomica sp.]|jgi:hypothetical protein|nr:hypothetical protein [Culturomica sp.]